MERKRVVIIEDDTFILKALEIKLEDKNVDIMVALDGVAGLQMVRDEKPDLVLLDLILPKMHGFKVLESLKNDKTTKDIPVIILTNLGQEEEEKKGRELGALDYFVKADTTLDQIIKRVDEVLASKI